MKREYVFIALFLGLVAVIFYLSYLVFAPFFIAITWGVIIVLTFFPIYLRLSRFAKNKTLSSLLMCLLVFAIIIAPVIFFSIQLVNEAVHAYANVEQYITSKEYMKVLSLRHHPLFSGIRNLLEQYVPLEDINLAAQVLSILNAMQSFILHQLRSTVGQFTKFLLNVIFVFFTMFYLFKDGERLAAYFKEVLPLSELQTQLILARLQEVIRASIYGGLIIAIAQGFLGGIMFWILGITTPVFWGVLMAFCSLLPLVGVWVVLGPAVGYFLIQGSIIKGLILLAWGAGVISTSDNFLRPYLVSGRTRIHPLLLFFSIFGGIQVFGFIGIFVGPVLASLFVALIGILRDQILEYRNEMFRSPEI